MGTDKRVVVAVSGGFDPLHRGHVRYFRDAKALGDRLVVILNTDEWLFRKKGHIFMDFGERREILEANRYVDEVFPSVDLDDTVAKSLSVLKPTIFAKGGDRTLETIPQAEKDACKKYGIRLVVGVGGGKVQSSSALTSPLLTKPWGYEHPIDGFVNAFLKELHLSAGMATSLHLHDRKRELFYVVVGEVELNVDGYVRLLKPGMSLHVEPGQQHQIHALSKAMVLEVGTSMFTEDDITRIKQ